MDLNEFYVVSGENNTPENELVMQCLSDKTCRGIIGNRVRNGYGFDSVSTTLYTETTTDDYDNAFCQMIVSINPPYEVDKLLDFHFTNYTKVKKGNKKRFYVHLRYVILPKLQKRQNKQVYVELVTKWLESKEAIKGINLNFLELKRYWTKLQ